MSEITLVHDKNVEKDIDNNSIILNDHKVLFVRIIRRNY